MFFPKKKDRELVTLHGKVKDLYCSVDFLEASTRENEDLLNDLEAK